MSFFGIPIRNGIGVGLGNYATLRNKPTAPPSAGPLSFTLLQIGLTTPSA